MDTFVISTDTMADLPEDYMEKNGLPVLSLTYTLDGQTYDKNRGLAPEDFYTKMRNGAMPTTSQINPAVAREELEPYMQAGKDVLHISFSSGLSGSYNSVVIAAQELMEEYPERKIIVVDSLCASMGEGLLVHKVLEQRAQGATLEETAAWAEANKQHICHNFTVDDLNHLYRGGRVSKATAVIGTMVNIKPVLHVDEAGKLINIDRVRGRKKSLVTLVDNMEKQMGSFREANDMIMISHGDCREDAEFVAAQVKERFGIDSCMINYVGPTIGAHSGPGTIALFFMGEVR